MKKENLEIITFFHPIISIQDKSIVALEALSRYRFRDEEKLRSIEILMAKMESEKEILELDLFLISRAIEAFNKEFKYDTKTLLFLNITSSIINQGEEGVRIIRNILRESSISPRKVVLEILEDDIDKSHKCWDFFSACRKASFLIALDDVGVGFSNLQRITEVKPHIIKVDRTLVLGLSDDYYKARVFESLTCLAHDIGALVVAEGVENKDDTLRALQLGAGLLQGYYFCKPDPSIKEIFKICSGKIHTTGSDLKKRIKWEKDRTGALMLECRQAVDSIVEEIHDMDLSLLDDSLEYFLEFNTDLECIYILNDEGIQVTWTQSVYKHQENKHFLFKPASKGADHSLKPYYIEPEGFHNFNVTSPYISKASGKSCITFSRRFKINEQAFILCADFTDFSDLSRTFNYEVILSPHI
jgi:EAL domain-containing protein (putative c-di-GMP-specific phosphodiesterase class I)